MKHGTVHAYTKHRCRCDECRAAKSAAALRYNERNRDKEAARARRWYAENQERVVQNVMRWRVENRDKHLANKRTRHALERVSGMLNTDVDYEALWTGMCGICGQTMVRDLPRNQRLSPTIDHIIPVSKGGAHAAANLQWAHMACNSGKGARL